MWVSQLRIWHLLVHLIHHITVTAMSTATLEGEQRRGGFLVLSTCPHNKKSCNTLPSPWLLIITDSWYHMAYLLVHSLAVELYFCLSVLNKRAISGTNGSSAFGSVSKEQMDKSTEKRQKDSHINSVAEYSDHFIKDSHRVSAVESHYHFRYFLEAHLPLLMVKAGDHWDLRISKQILPLLLMFGWYIFVVNATCNTEWVYTWWCYTSTRSTFKSIQSNNNVHTTSI